MERYDKKIMDRLLDSYEESTLFDGKNKMTVHIAFPFNKKNIPAYFDESSLVYEEIHAAMQELEWRGFIDIIWRKGKEGHIISKVVLRTENLEEAYAYVSRVSKADRIRENRALLAKLRERFDTPVYQAFMQNSMRTGKCPPDAMDCRYTRIYRATAC